LLRPKLFLLIQFLVAVAVFAASFPLMLHFAAQWQVVVVLLLSALAVSLLLSQVTYRILAKYVPVETAP
jgi:low affinity Fe/Cu permease